MKVLVADDDPIYRDLLQALLGRWGYEAITVEDGLSAWQILQSDEAPPMVLLDWSMPGLEGPQICRQVRQLPRDRYTYMLLLTSKRDRSDVVEGLEAGADDYLSKPLNPAELNARLNTGRRILQIQHELISAREAMRRRATRDALTNVWNHAAILEILESELACCRRESRSAGIVLADLDHFKEVNDVHGHLVGDGVLRTVSERIVGAVRPDDIVGRYGGEEFLIILPGCDSAGTLMVCERIRARICGSPIMIEGHAIARSLSLGAVVYQPPASLDAIALVRAADKAMYRAKSAGRNCVVMADGP